MFKRPMPWFVRQAPTLYRRAKTLRTDLFEKVANIGLGDQHWPEHQLVDKLLEASSKPWLTASLLEPLVRSHARKYGTNAVLEQAEQALAKQPHRRSRSRLYRAVLLGLADDPNGKHLDFGHANRHHVAGSMRCTRVLAILQEQAGMVEEPLGLLSTPPLALVSKRRRDRLHKHAQLLRHGVGFQPSVVRDWQPSPGRILYHASQSQPHHSSGYAIRTHWIAKTLKDLGQDIEVFTRHGYPNDRWDFTGVAKVATEAQIDGLPYHFAPTKERLYFNNEIAGYQKRAVATLIKQCESYRPALIHTASNYTCGLAGVEAARRLGIPSVYEVRGLWHMTRASKQPAYDGSDHYRLIDKLEAQAAANADHVFAITGAVKAILVAQGVDADKISILPNAVDPTRFEKRPRNRELEQRLGLADKLVIGYIGSTAEYEGLDYLLRAAAKLREGFRDRFRVVIVGDGLVFADLRALARQLGIDDIVYFTGRVDHNDIADYYSLLDVFALPRKGVRVCEVVSPLKPFEAMASGITVVASDVAALGEIVDHEYTGLLHKKDDIASLTSQLALLIENPTLRAQLNQNARQWIVEQRSWERVCQRITEVYSRLLATTRDAVVRR